MHASRQQVAVSSRLLRASPLQNPLFWTVRERNTDIPLGDISSRQVTCLMFDLSLLNVGLNLGRFDTNRQRTKIKSNLYHTDTSELSRKSGVRGCSACPGCLLSPSALTLCGRKSVVSTCVEI